MKVWLFLVLATCGYGVLTAVSGIESQGTRGLLAWPIGAGLYLAVHIFWERYMPADKELGVLSLASFLIMLVGYLILRPLQIAWARIWKSR